MNLLFRANDESHYAIIDGVWLEVCLNSSWELGRSPQKDIEGELTLIYTGGDLSKYEEIIRERREQIPAPKRILPWNTEGFCLAEVLKFVPGSLHIN